MLTLIAPLCEAVARGVQVTLLIKPSHAQDVDWRWAQQNLWRPLKDCGVLIHEYRDDMHEKFVVIDGNITYQGSLNPGSHKDTTESSLRIVGQGPAEVILNLYHPDRGASAAAKEVRITRPISAARLGGEHEALQGGVSTESIRWESRAPTGPCTPPDSLFGET